MTKKDREQLFEHSQILMKQGKFAHVVKLLEDIVSDSETDSRIVWSLGWSLMYIGRRDEAIEHLRRAFESEPGN